MYILTWLRKTHIPGKDVATPQKRVHGHQPGELFEERRRGGGRVRRAARDERSEPRAMVGVPQKFINKHKTSLEFKKLDGKSNLTTPHTC